MRLLVRRQGIVSVPFNRCACSTYRAVERLDDMIEHLRQARHGQAYQALAPTQQEQFAWDYVRHESERVPERLLALDGECGLDTSKFNQEIQDSIRARDFSRLVEAVASVKLRLCGTEIPSGYVAIPYEKILEAAAETERREKEMEGLR